MGWIFGPSIAYLYNLIFEKNWLDINQPKFYYRFLDDLCLSVKEHLKLISFKESFGNLELNIETGDNLNFLDLSISTNKLTSRLKHSVFIKPTNTFQYLHV